MNELQARVRSQMNAIGLIGRGREAGQKDQVVGLVSAVGLGEHGHDLRQPLTIPDWGSAIHRRRDHEEAVRIRRALILQQSQHILKHRLNAKSHGRGSVDGGQEVSHARQNDDGRLRPDLFHAWSKKSKVATRKNLGILQHGANSTARLVEVLPDVRIAEKRELMRWWLRHRRQRHQRTDAPTEEFKKRLRLFL